MVDSRVDNPASGMIVQWSAVDKGRFEREAERALEPDFEKEAG